ncbi:peroxidase 5-like [Beta vulgaris subsp. vulgaris]|uniref:peroxidase 5-like n=1 Tax=Beta vulgaris subsp. vulgaris TaxID=3555 RepID=UPI0020374BF5|nr:peroxidase 5-like [Beta vulgaris subsp. vulgaris]
MSPIISKCHQISTTTIAFVSLVLLSLSGFLEADLQRGFYMQSCPMAEFIVKDEVRQAFFSDRGYAAGLVRLHFHDCFVRGCDGSVLLDSTPGNTAEKDAAANNPSLRGFDVIDNAKARLENLCPGVVSCADILAYAARDSVEMTGGFGYDVPGGRRDGRVSSSSEATRNLPPPFADVDLLTKIFGSKGLTQEEMVILSGAHTIGRSHCTSFSNRLYSFSTTAAQDPSINSAYAAQLQRQCPAGNAGANIVVPMDPISPTISDTAYYRNILNNRGLFTSDQALLSDSTTASLVTLYARNPGLWGRKFATAMGSMGQIGVLTGDEGEIRSNCRVIN